MGASFPLLDANREQSILESFWVTESSNKWQISFRKSFTSQNLKSSSRIYTATTTHCRTFQQSKYLRTSAVAMLPIIKPTDKFAEVWSDLIKNELYH